MDCCILVECERDDFDEGDDDHLKRARLSEQRAERNEHGGSGEVSSQQTERRDNRRKISVTRQTQKHNKAATEQNISAQNLLTRQMQHRNKAATEQHNKTTH